VAFPVDKTDKSLVAVDGNLLLQMFPHHIRLNEDQRLTRTKGAQDAYRVGQIHNLQVGFVSQSVHLRPEYRHTAAYLDKAHLGAKLARFCVFNQEKLLRFVEVGNVPVVVDSTSEITRASTETRTAADKTYLYGTPVQSRIADVEGWNFVSREQSEPD
jgi:hypothetical protein